MREAEEAIRKNAEDEGRDEIERAKKAISQEDQKSQARDIGDMLQALKHVPTRRVLMRLLDLCDPFQESFSTEPIMMARMEGIRHIGRNLVRMIGEADPSAYYQMHRERASDSKNDAARRAKLLGEPGE